MPGEKIAFIINPVSGRRQKTKKVDLIRKHLDDKRFDPVFFTTKHRGHARELVYELAEKGYSTIIAVGGDGTVNEVNSAAADLKLKVGIIPSGSGNGLARHLKIPVDLTKAVNIINKGRSTFIDAGKLNDIWFFCTCGIGFDAKIGRKFSKIKVRGFASYIRTVIREFRRYNSKKYKFETDGKKVARRAFLITVANASQYGNNAIIAPQARIDDGLFDVCILRPFPIIKVIGLAIMLFRKSIDESSYYEVLKAKEIQFRKKRKKFIFHYDGEPVKLKKTKINISMHPKCLEIIVPESGSQSL